MRARGLESALGKRVSVPTNGFEMDGRACYWQGELVNGVPAAHRFSGPFA